MKSKIWLALFALYIAWGSTYLAIRFAVETIPPFFMAGTRFLIAGLLVYTWRRLAGDPAPTRAQWRSSAIIGLFLLLGGNGIVSWAEQRVPSGIAALIVAAVPLWVVVVDALRPRGNRPTWQTSVGVLIGMAGIVVLVGPTSLASGQSDFDLVGVGALLLAALFWAVGSVYGRGADLPKSSLLGAGMEMLAGSAGLFLAGLASGEASRLDVMAITPTSLLGLGYLIVFGSLVGFVSYSWLLRAAPTSLVVTYAYVNPLVAVMLGSLLADEALTPSVLVATPLILSAVALINMVRTKVKTPSTAPALITAVPPAADAAAAD
jgi:drug/metabolite transporter (DMT)-like permease